MNSEIKIFTDGGARGNPGPSAIGVYITGEGGKELARIGKTIGVGTNNVAEYNAVLEALSWILENKNKQSGKVKISFFLDSLLVYSQIVGLFKVKDSNLRGLLFDVRQKEAQINLPILYFHVRREKNKVADSLVNYALDQA